MTFIVAITRNIIKFIEESNKIERISEFDVKEQFEAYESFFRLPEITSHDIVNLAEILHESSSDKYASRHVPKIRGEGMSVRVGNHHPMRGGKKLKRRYQELLRYINLHQHSKIAYEVHKEYETLHPLTDCNGRTGRAIWAWLMLKDGYDFSLGFLHKWYYQSLDDNRV